MSESSNLLSQDRHSTMPASTAPSKQNSKSSLIARSSLSVDRPTLLRALHKLSYGNLTDNIRFGIRPKLLRYPGTLHLARMNSLPHCTFTIHRGTFQ